MKFQLSRLQKMIIVAIIGLAFCCCAGLYAQPAADVLNAWAGDLREIRQDIESR